MNSVAETVDGGRESTIYDEVKASVNAIFTITPDLKINATASVTNDWERWQKYILTVYTYTWDGEQANNVINDTSYIRESQLATTYENYGVYANYTKKVGKDHNFAALFGVNAEKEQYKYLYAHRSDFEDNGIYDLNLGSEETLVSTDGGASAYGFYSYVGRLNYNYKSKYLAEINFRRDGSSKFADGFKWANFGGASLGWIISEENFMQDIKFLDYLKLRGSYGQMGNQAGISNYSSYSTVSFGTQIFGYDAAYQTTSSLGITSATTTWERVSSVSAGLDFTMFNNRLSGSVDAFHKVNDNMLISVTYPDVLGATAPKSNYGRLETRGWEFALRWADRVKEFSYNIGFNIGDSNNLLTNMEGAESYEAGLNSYREGYPLNSYFLYKTDGFFANQTEVDAYYEAVGNGGEVPSQSSTSTTLRPGDTKKVDIDGDGQINATGGNGGDLMYMGDADPHYYYGLDFGFNYKGFDFSAMFQGVLSQNIVRTGYLAYPFNYQYTNQTPSYIGLTWTEENTSASYPRMTANLDRADWNWANNDFMLQNNRYIRLKSLVIGYTFQNIKALEKLRVYFAGNDLFEFSSIWDGYDPEYGDTTNSSYPFTRTFSFGANLTF